MANETGREGWRHEEDEYAYKNIAPVFFRAGIWHRGGSKNWAKVMGFAANAFQNIPLGDYSGHLQLSGDVVFIGAHCFENCGLTDVVFEKNNLTGKDFLETLVVDDGAFAHNPELWGIYFRDREIVLGNGIWEGWGIGESISITEACGYGFWERNIPEREVSFLAGDLEPDIYDGYIRYTEICAVNGYAKNQKAWEENGRVKRLLMYVENKPYACLELEDTIYPQYFKLPTDAIKAAQGVDVHFRFVIEDVDKGTKYEDTCLTGLIVDFMGRRGH